MTDGWGTDSNAAAMKRLHARNARQLIVLQNTLDETRGKLAGAERRAQAADARIRTAAADLHALCNGREVIKLNMDPSWVVSTRRVLEIASALTTEVPHE